MTLASFTVELRRTNELLERLCVAVEFAAGMHPAQRPEAVKKAGLDDVSRISSAGMLKAELEREMKRQNPGRGGVAVEE